MKIVLVVSAMVALIFSSINVFAADVTPAIAKKAKVSKEEQNFRKADASCRKQASMAVKAQAMQYRMMHGEKPNVAILLTEYTEFYATCLDRELGDITQVIEYANK